MKPTLSSLIFFTLLIHFITGFNETLAQDYSIRSYDLCNSWKVFNKKTKTYQEFRPIGRFKYVKFNLGLKENTNGWLEIAAPTGSSVLINGDYFGIVQKNLSINLDSLLGASHRNVFEFTVYRESGLTHTNLSTIVYERVPNDGAALVRKVNNEDFMNYYVLGGMLILLFIGFLYRKFPRDTKDYFSFLRSISFKNREETLISSRPFNRTNILFMILDSFLIGFLIVSMVHLASGHVYFPFIKGHMSFSDLLIGWLGCSVTVFFSMVLKYLLIIIFNNLFRLGDFRYVQHFNSLRYSIGAFLFIFLLTTFTFLTIRIEGLEVYFIFTRILVFLLLVRILVLFFKLRDFTSFRNFHLFSYLCGTEIIPFIILYKLVLG